jgi:hypothetical protein
MMEKCKKYNFCSAPICPLDKEASIRVQYSNEETCPYCRIQKKQGIRQKMPEKLRVLVPEKNLYLLSYKNK